MNNPFLTWLFHLDRSPVTILLYVFSTFVIFAVLVVSFILWTFPDPHLARGVLLAATIDFIIFIIYTRSP